MPTINAMNTTLTFTGTPTRTLSDFANTSRSCDDVRGRRVRVR